MPLARALFGLLMDPAVFSFVFIRITVRILFQSESQLVGIKVSKAQETSVQES